LIPALGAFFHVLDHRLELLLRFFELVPELLPRVPVFLLPFANQALSFLDVPVYVALLDLCLLLYLVKSLFFRILNQLLLGGFNVSLLLFLSLIGLMLLFLLDRLQILEIDPLLLLPPLVFNRLFYFLLLFFLFFRLPVLVFFSFLFLLHGNFYFV